MTAPAAPGPRLPWGAPTTVAWLRRQAGAVRAAGSTGDEAGPVPSSQDAAEWGTWGCRAALRLSGALASHWPTLGAMGHHRPGAKLVRVLTAMAEWNVGAHLVVPRGAATVGEPEAYASRYLLALRWLTEADLLTLTARKRVALQHADVVAAHPGATSAVTLVLDAWAAAGVGVGTTANLGAALLALPTGAASVQMLAHSRLRRAACTAGGSGAPARLGAHVAAAAGLRPDLVPPVLAEFDCLERRDPGLTQALALAVLGGLDAARLQRTAPADLGWALAHPHAPVREAAFLCVGRLPHAAPPSDAAAGGAPSWSCTAA